MATYYRGGVRKATPNTVNAQQRSAENRRCPKCGRKSALRHYSDELMFGYACRWCDYESMTIREV